MQFKRLLVISGLFCILMSSCNYELFDSYKYGIRDIGSGDGMVWASIPYQIRLPKYDSLDVNQDHLHIKYADNQVIVVKSKDVWLNPQDTIITWRGPYATERLKPISYKGYTICTFNPDQVYINEKTTDVSSKDSLYRMEEDVNNDSRDYIKPIEGRCHRIFEKDGVKVYLYNILPKNMEKFYKITYRSAKSIPFDKSYLKNWKKK